jgi:hypothetical protein
VAVLVLVVTLAGWLGFRNWSDGEAHSEKSPSVAKAVPMPSVDAVIEEKVSHLTQAEQAQSGSPLVAELLRREGTAVDDIEIVRQLISQYFTALQSNGGPPIGDNADLVRALTGKNPLRLTVIPPGHAALNADGQLLDRWGTPYHLHRVAERSFEIRSAGPDRQLFTADDVVGGR